MKLYLALAAALMCVPVAAAAQDFDGVRAEARIGYETPTVSGNGQVYKIGSAASFGGELGYDFKLGPKVVAGPYAVYEFSTVKLCSGPDCIKEKGNLGVGGRIGIAVAPNVLIYAKAGYARITFDANTAFGSGSDSKGGVQGALGIDYNFSKHVYGLVELNYGDYGKFYGVNLQRRHALAGVGVRF